MAKKRNNRRGKQNNKRTSQKRDDGSFELTLKAMAHGGYALGSYKRRTTFVPYTIPGETILARVTDSQKSVDFAQGVQLLSASGDRVFPQCPHFGPGKCWGCQWQHIAYDAQLLLKQDVLADQLSRLGKFDDPTLEKAMHAVTPSPQQWGYNHHMSFTRRPDGKFGLPQVDGRSIEPIDTCFILHPDLRELREQLEIDFSDLSGVSLYVGSDGKTMILLAMSSEDVPELSADMPTSVNVVLPDNEPANLVGDAAVNFAVGGRNFRMTAGGFFRANIAQIDNLVQEVLSLLDLQGGEAVLDLYAGVGIFSAFIAPRAALVTLVESYPPMATDAEVNLAEFENVDIVEGSVEEMLQVIINEGGRYDAAVLDPPPGGISKSALTGLLDLDIQKLVYVSSDPASLARDGRALAKAGYTLKAVKPLDFAPQTYYIDCVALFSK